MRRTLLTLAGALLLTTAAYAAVAVEKKAPDFRLQGADGKTYRLADYAGKTVVLEWVNFGCPFVRKHYDSKNMQALQQTYTDSGVVWLSICSSAPGKQGHYESGDPLNAQLKKESAVPTAYLVDADGAVGRAFGARTTPHMFVINPEGNIAYAGGIDDIRSANAADIPKATNYVAAALDALFAGDQIVQSSSAPYGCSVKYAD